MTDIVERLRGTYRIPVTDGLGNAGGETDSDTEFVRSFPVVPIQMEAASEIESLRIQLKQAEERAEYAWKNTNTIERERQRLEALEKEIVSLRKVKAQAEQAVICDSWRSEECYDELWKLKEMLEAE